MILDLRESEEFPVRKTLEAVGGIAAFREDVSSVGVIRLELTIQQTGEEYFCQGEVSADVVLDCARCLSSYEVKLLESTNFIVTTQEVRDQQKAEAIDDEDYVIMDGGDLRVDLTETIRQILLATLPIIPVCDASCRGLCDQCGANLNLQPCSCGDKETDPRWAGLKKLRDQAKPDERK
ncbi:MAG: DUF177 domain-containing protein [candidate division Zixibacteria bacterium]